MQQPSTPSAWQQLSSRQLSTQQVRWVDQQAVQRYGMHSLVLMENAAIECAYWIRQRFKADNRIVVLCGPGNNGGDGLVITRQLRSRGWSCQCFILGPASKFSPDAYQNAKILQAAGGSGLQVIDPEHGALPTDELSSAGLIVDAMLGTGARGPARRPLCDWIEAANQAPAFRLAIDIPTGVDADSGQLFEPVFQADATLTFVALKPSMVSANSAAIYGELHVLPIGIPEQLILEVVQLDSPAPS
ncbi:MAG: NAD(P)H-hydrate epimerase [Pirellulaceae bacterium]|nr:NAD(P)H-hydrate epimerase [Pirellulaceae bacterium]